jgi:hypothetical protein
MASTTTQVLELLLAFGLSALVGLEREVRGKSAGIRTQTIVGTSSALILLVGKYGFGDVLGTASAGSTGWTRRLSDRGPSHASMTTGMIIGRRRSSRFTQRPTTRRTTCWSW